MRTDPLYFLNFIPREGEGAGAGGAEDGDAGAAAAAAAAAAAKGGADNGKGGDPFWKSFGFDPKTDKEAVDFLTAKNPPDPKTAVQSWMSADKTARDRNAIALPEKDKPLAEWEGWKKLGWTDDVAKYGEAIKPNEKTAAAFKAIGVDLDAAEHDHFVKSAHARRVPPTVANELYEDLAQMRLTRVNEIQTRGAAAKQQLKEALQKEWGANTPRNQEIATRTAKALGLSLDDAKKLNEFIDDAGLMKMFHKIGDSLGEDFLANAKDAGGGLPANVDGLRAELNRLQSDPEWMKVFKDPRHAQHKAHVQQRQGILDKIATAEQKQAA